MKYARPIASPTELDPTRTTMVDLFDTTVYEPKPSWWTSDDAALERIFQGHEQEWKSAGEWFVTVPDNVQPYATHAGSDYSDPDSYTNP